jgi:hypothetical protein
MDTIGTTHVTVGAPVEGVWRTLTDLTGYQTWNPYLIAAAGTISVGERVNLTIQPPGGRRLTYKPWVTAVEPHRYLEWFGRLFVSGMFTARHSFTLTSMAGGRTLVQQSGTFSGVLVRFFRPMLDRTRCGFEAMNEALFQSLSAAR